VAGVRDVSLGASQSEGQAPALESAAELTFSTDRRWWWDGQHWVAAISPDGAWRWDGAAWRPAGPGARREQAAISPPSTGSQVARSIFSLGPILAGVGAGAVYWLPTHDLAACAWQGGLIWLGMVVIRLIDPVLSPLWRLLRHVPGVLRLAAALGVAVWYSINQFGPDAANQEVARFQLALFASIAAAYVLLRPGRGGYKAPA
jgi:hypothetical protein